MSNTTSKTRTRKPKSKTTAKTAVVPVNDVITENLEKQINELKVVIEQQNIQALTLSTQKEVSDEKIARILGVILERFDGDGVDDLDILNGKITIWKVLGNIGGITKMIREIVAIIKEEGTDTMTAFLNKIK